MEERDRIRYETLFYCQKLEDGFLSGDNARALFIRSKLPLLDLTRIWKLADLTRDNKLDVFEFSLAMHFIELKLLGGEIPKQNDMATVEVNQEVVFPIITFEEKQQVKDIFLYADKNSQGFLELDIVKPMLLSSGLSSSTLSKIWDIADLDKAGRLCLFKFTIALHLLKNCVRGINLNGPVNPFACVSDEENTAHLFKEKLAVFDKEFILRQKNNEKKLILNSTDFADSSANFDLLNCYLFDGQNVPTPGKTELDSVDENRNTFHNHQLNKNSQDCESVVNARGPDQNCTETIERIKVNTSQMDIDLENLFETVSKENMAENEDSPKFVPRLPVGFAESDEDKEEISDSLPYFQRRTYFGKDLIFEDPIGSELIGDVEFEVDFQYIINDIEKEMVDEERRLPIARVLPIYKTPPVLDQQLYEKSVINKGSGDKDLNFVDEKKVISCEQENRGLDNMNVVIGTGTNESHVPHQGMITKDESRTYKLLSREENAKRSDSVRDTVDDIVEQKRLLLQNKQEERKKLRENRRNEMINEHSILESTPVVWNAEQTNDKSSYGVSLEKETKRKDILNNGNDSVVKIKDPQPTFKNDDVAVANPDKGSYTNEKETNRNGVYSKSNNENHYEHEEEKRVREAEEKERVLLERIKFLERKRQKLFEKKQRELNPNNSKEDHTENHQVGVHAEKNLRKHQVENLKISASADAWSSSHSKQHPEETSEDEKRRLAEALAAKRKAEAEIERQREEVKRAAEERRLEEEAKQREEQEAAKERKRNFMENLQKLKQRVTEEEEKSKGSKSQSKHEPIGVVHSAGRFSPILTSSTKPQTLPGFTEGRSRSSGAASSDAIQTNVLPQTKTSQYEVNVDSSKRAGNVGIKPDEKLENEEDQKKADEMRRENFKSNRELFMRKIKADAEQNVHVQKREKIKKIRPKSYYGGMFNKPVHQIVDDSLLVQNVDFASSGDLVDEEAVKQFQREKELKEEHEKVNKLRSSLERDSSYTVENVEQLFCEPDTESKKETRSDWDNLQRKETKVSSHPHRRSLVNTLTTEWNSFLDILEDDKRRESETLKMRQEISAQEDDSRILGKNPKERGSSKLSAHETDDKRFEQENIIKENAPKRKTDLAHAWTHIISNQPNPNANE